MFSERAHAVVERVRRFVRRLAPEPGDGPLDRAAAQVFALAGIAWRAVVSAHRRAARPFARWPVPVRAIGWLSIAAVWATLIYTVLEHPRSRVVVVGERQLARVTTKALNVRGGPGSDYPIRSRVWQDEQLEVLDATDDWVHVRLGAEGDGWVSTRYIRGEVESIRERRTAPRRGWILLLVASATYGLLVGLALVAPASGWSKRRRPRPGRRVELSAETGSRPGRTVRRSAAVLQGDAVGSTSRGPGPGGASRASDEGKGRGDRTALLAQLRAARRALTVAVPDGRHGDFRRLWNEFQRRVLAGLDAGGRG